MSAATSVTSNRSEIYARIQRRNKFVSWLRIAVPVIGALIFIALVGQLIAANLANQILPNGVRIERETLVIDAPSYSGVMQDGTRYTIVSEVAEAALNATDVFDLRKARIDMVRPSGQEVVSTAEQAQFDFSTQRIKVAGVMHIVDSDGTIAELHNSVFDMTAQSLDTSEHVHMIFADGSVLTARTLHFDAATQEWDFGLVELVIPEASE